MGDEQARVLLVGASNGFAAACRRAAARAGADIEQCDLTSASERAAEWSPHVILLSSLVFASNPALLEAIAERHRATLASVNADSIDSGELDILLEASLAAAEERRLGPREPEGERGRVLLEGPPSIAPPSYRAS